MLTLTLIGCFSKVLEDDAEGKEEAVKMDQQRKMAAEKSKRRSSVTEVGLGVSGAGPLEGEFA